MASCRSLMAMASRGCSRFSLPSPFAANDGDSGRMRSSKAARATRASLRGKLKRMGNLLWLDRSWQISAAEDGTHQRPVSCGPRPQPAKIRTMTDPKPEVGTVAWVDLTVPEAETLRDFYRDVAGWRPAPVTMAHYTDATMKPPA